MRTLFTLMLALAAGGVLTTGSPKAMENLSTDYWVYIGTYTTKGSKGIYIYRLDTNTGKLTPAGTGPTVVNPSFVAVSPNRRNLYAVDEVSDLNGTKAGGISAFTLDPKTGALTLLNQQSSGGDGPCHVSVDRSGKVVLAANYGSGSVCALPILGDGRLGESTAFIQHAGKGSDPGRQEGPHAHSIYADPENRCVYTCDLGLDKVFIYRLDPSDGTLTRNEPEFATVAPGSGPRHLAFHPNGHFVYVINEMACTVTAFSRDAHSGALHSLQTTSTFPNGTKPRKGDSTAEVQVSRDGRFLYGSNRGRDTIAIFSIDPHSGKLTYVGEESVQGKTPRNFCIDPTGKFLLAANQDSDNVVVFRVDQHTGRLSPTGDTLSISMPVCVTYVPVEE